MAEIGPDAPLAGGGEAALLIETNPVEPLLAAEAALLLTEAIGLAVAPTSRLVKVTGGPVTWER